MSGANGGGIIIIKSPVINNTGFKINAKGADVINCSLSPIDLCHDGSGGGGGGGAVLIESNNFTSSTLVDVSGGKGGDLVIYHLPNASRIGPGGGGGAGVFWTNSPSIPANINVIKNGGKNGVIIQDANDPYGATPGQDGIDLAPVSVEQGKPLQGGALIMRAAPAPFLFDHEQVGKLPDQSHRRHDAAGEEMLPHPVFRIAPVVISGPVAVGEDV